MTSFQKIAVTATLAGLAAAIFTAVYQIKQARDARAEAQKLWAQQKQSAEQISNLQTERENLTNQLATLLAENARLKNDSNELELLKLRGEVTRLRPLQDDVVALQKMLNQSSAGLADWKTNDLADAGRASPIDTLRTYLYSARFDPAKIQNNVVGDDADPPDQEALENFIKTENNHPVEDVTGYKVLSQTWLGPDKVQVDLKAFLGNGGLGVSVPFTLRNVNGERKLVVFNVRDKNGKFDRLAFINESP